MGLWNNLKNIMIYGGLEKEDYRAVQKSIEVKNRKMLCYTSAICLILFVSMLLSTFLPAKTERMEELRLRSRFIYALLVIVCGISIMVGNSVKREYNRFVIIEWYIFLSILFSFAIWAGTYNQPYYPSTTFFVFLFALPLLIIERPVRLCIYLLIVSIVFIICSIQTKNENLIELDFMNCLCFIYLSITLSTIMMVSKYKEAINKLVIEDQRDKDELTELLNKTAIEREVCKCLERGEKGFLIIIDIDNFKCINDHYGHLFGDATLCTYAKCLRKISHESSLLGRFGGDEFIVFAKKESFEEVERSFEEVKKELKAMLNFPIQNNIVFTMSAGASFFDGKNNNYKRLFELADQALYEAKQDGKNQIKIK